MTVDVTAVPINFDPDQEYQLAAIRAVRDLFKGQPKSASAFEIADPTAGATLLSEYGVGNQLLLANEQIHRNLVAIQDENSIPEVLRGDSSVGISSLDFSIEMETGTGKTYVYLRTVFDLNREYGFTKFLVVVPSIAVREGVEANLRLLRTHFASLYDGAQYDVLTYDSGEPGRLRAFAQANHLQIMVINIDSFNKEVNRIHQSQDQMMGNRPIDFIQACAPIVILDEPQNMETANAKRAIASLNPLVTLRYSATHRNAYHQLYRLTPVDAYRNRLVKRIEVWSVLEDIDGNRPYIKLLKVTANKKSVSAQIELMAVGTQGVHRKRTTLRALTDLALESGLAQYDGFVVEEINAADNYVEFSNGIVIRSGDGTTGIDREQVQRQQIRTAVTEHLERELDIHRRVQSGEILPTKVLSLFFIDKVDHYAPDDGKFRRWFREEYSRAAAMPKYEPLSLPEVDKVHNGYFARDSKGRAKNSTTGTSRDDEKAYDLIMRDKQSLLSVAEPLRFIFSHSALREGWDNPNVFVICTLNESISELKKRQEIGRGLRLPVMADGNRCTHERIARLTVVANESYEEFAAALQHEIETETGTSFSKTLVKNARTSRNVAVRKGYDTDPEFMALWQRIMHRTTYRVSYSSEELIRSAKKILAEKPKLSGSFVRSRKGTLDLTGEGVTTTAGAEKAPVLMDRQYAIPDLLSALSRTLPVSRSTIARILVESGTLGEAKINPQQFIDNARASVEEALAELLVKGIAYERIGAGANAMYEMRLLEDVEITSYVDNLVEMTNDKAPYREIVFDSELEREIAIALDLREDIKAFLKLPGWFSIDTPVGKYNPDWAYVKADENEVNRLYLVRESKPTTDTSKLRPSERLKVAFGGRHFEALDVSFAVIDDPDQI